MEELRQPASNDEISPPLSMVPTVKLSLITKSCRWNEYVLNRQPSSLKELVNVYHQYSYRIKFFLWITNKSFVTNMFGHELMDLPIYKVDDYSMALKSTQTQYFYSDYHFLLAGLSLEDACDGLDYLTQLPDTCYDTWICSNWSWTKGSPVTLCPFFQKILISRQKLSFDDFNFSAVEARALASAGTRTTIEFRDCEFQDEGTAFVQAYAESGAMGPATIVLSYKLPFSVSNFCLLLDESKLDALTLSRTMSKDKVMMELVRYIREGRGPKKLRFDLDHGLFPEKVIDALKGNSYLEHIHICSSYDQGLKGLPSALMDNKGLTGLGIGAGTCVEEFWFEELLTALSRHPAIQTVKFDYLVVNGEDKGKYVRAIAEMLTMNPRIEVMSAARMSRHDDWNKKVVPQLEYNRYLKRFQAIRNDSQLVSARPALIGKALMGVHDHPSLVWLCFSLNMDIVATYFIRSASSDTRHLPKKRECSDMLDEFK